MDITIAVFTYLDAISNDRAQTRHTYRWALASFTDFLHEKTGKSLPTLSDLWNACLADYTAWLGHHDKSKFTQRTYPAAARAFLRFCAARDMLPSSFSLEKARAIASEEQHRFSYPIQQPSNRLPSIIDYYDQMRLPDGHGKPLTPARRIERLGILRARAFVHLLYSSAARLSEIAGLDRESVGNGAADRAGVIGKGNKERYIYLTQNAKDAIVVYLQERADTHYPLFISHKQNYGRRVSASTLYNIVVDAAQALGFKCHPHDFRHYRAVSMLEHGAPLHGIQSILGHANIGTTRQVYATSDDAQIERIFRETTVSPSEALHATERG